MGCIHPTTELGSPLPAFIKRGVAVVLFDGGFNLRLHELKQVAGGVRRLVFPGAPLAWILGSGLAHYLGGLSRPVALIFGVIRVVKGAHRLVCGADLGGDHGRGGGAI